MVPPGTNLSLEELQDLLTRYRRRLLDLSQRNRSLKLPRLSAQRDIDLTDLGYLDAGPAEAILGSAVQRQSVVIMRRMQAADEGRTAADRRLTGIYRELNLMQAETGRYDLGVGYPWVEGRMADGSVVRCPLLILPVRLERGSSQKKGALRWSLRIKQGDTPIWNEPFFRAYERVQATPLPTEFWQTEWPPCTTVQALLNALFAVLRRHGVLLAIPSALFLGRIEPFKPYIKNYLDQLAHDELRLQAHAVLGIFPQAESAVAQDYQALHLPSMAPRLAQLLTPRRGVVPLPQTHLELPLPTDPSQEQVLQYLAQGHDLVVDGPPGTGKSQVITNAVCLCLSQGKQVLVVSAKRAALDVVHQRLQALGLANWCSLLHDHRQDRAGWVQHHAPHLEALLQPPDPEALRNALGALAQARAAHAEVLARLEAHRQAMTAPTEPGPSPAELYEKLLQAPPVPVPPPQVQRHLKAWNEARLSAFLRMAVRLGHYGRLLQEGHPWFYRLSTAGWGTAQVQHQTDRLNKLAAEWTEVVALQHWVTPTGATRPLTSVALRAEATWAERLLHQANGNASWPIMAQWQDSPPTKAWWDEICRVQQQLSHAQLPQAEAPYIGTLLAAQAPRYTLNPRKLRLRMKLRRWLTAHQLKPGRATLTQLRDEVTAWHRWQELRGLHNGATHLPPNPHDPAWQHWLPGTDFTTWHKELWAHPWQDGTKPAATADQALHYLHQTLARWQGQVRRWAELYEGWRGWLHPRQVDALDSALPHPEEGAGIISRWLESWARDGPALAELDSQVAAWPEPEQEVWEWLGPLVPVHKNWQERAQCTAWQVWLAQAESERPALAYGHTPMHQADRAEMPVLEAALRQAVQQWLPQALHQQAHQGLAQAPAAALAELRHQLAKARRPWPLRRLFHQFWTDVLRHSCRCVLASPETVSQIMPLQAGLADVVILDEASQVTVEAVLPTLLRGTQALVAGDEQQLPPFDLFQVNPLEEAEYAAAEDDPDNDNSQAPGPAVHELWQDAESILQLCRRSWPHIPLQWHYRSRQQELMTFSNRHFYGGQLRVVPVAGVPEPAFMPPLRYRQVKGLWHQRRNLPEAQAVVAELRRWVLLPHPPSLGVITLNYGQREAITDALEAHLESLRTPETQSELAAWAEALRGADDGPSKGLFIKNLENVQGDERDVILLSVGYAPNPSGRLRAHYGWLNLPGGEKRLNVAVSRARQCLVVVSHLHPAELPLNEDALVGPRMLAAYLHHALQVSGGALAASGADPWLHCAEMPQQWQQAEGLCTITEDQRWLNAGSARALYGQVVPLLQERGWQVHWRSLTAAWRQSFM